MAGAASQAGDADSSWAPGLTSDLQGPWMSTVVLYCWCHSDSALILLYFTLFKISNSFSIHKKWPILCFRSPLLQSKQVVLIRSALTYLRCIADQTRSKYDQPMLYRRPPSCTPAQHTTCGELDHARPFFNRLKNLSRSLRPLRAGPTNPRCNLDQHTLSPIKARSLPIRPFFQSGRERGLIGSLVWTGLYRYTHLWYRRLVDTRGMGTMFYKISR